MSSINGAGKTESEIHKQCLLGGKRVSMDRHTGELREFHPHGGFIIITFMGHFFQVFLQPIILLCLVLSLYLVSLYFRALPCEPTHLLAKMDPSEGAYGQADITYYKLTSPLITSKEPFWARVVEVSLTLRMRNMRSFISYLGRLSPSLSCCFGVAVQRGETSCSPRGPSSSCLCSTFPPKRPHPLSWL